MWLLVFVVILVLVFVLMLGSFFVFQGRRARRLQSRPERSLDALLDDLRVTHPDERRLIRKALLCLGKHLDVEPTRLRHNDRFDRELDLSGFVGLPDTSLEMFFEDLRALLAREGVPRWPKYRIRDKSLSDLVVDLRDALAKRPPEDG